MPFLGVEEAMVSLFQNFRAGQGLPLCLYFVSEVWDHLVQIPASTLNASSNTLQMEDLVCPYGESRLEDCTIVHIIHGWCH